MENKQCHVCERWTTGYISFIENDLIKLAVCMECISVGVKWVINKGREEHEKV